MKKEKFYWKELTNTNILTCKKQNIQENVKTVKSCKQNVLRLTSDLLSGLGC